MLRPMGMPTRTALATLALTAALATSCTGDGARMRGAATAVSHLPAESAASEAQNLCERALRSPVAASSAATVGEVRDFVVGGPPPLTPDPSRRPARGSFATASASDRAAWCTVATGDALTFYAAGPDGTAVKLESVHGYQGAVPDRPVAIP
jgi:hypothetical protein